MEEKLLFITDRKQREEGAKDKVAQDPLPMNYFSQLDPVF